MKKFFSVNNGKKGIFVAKNIIIFAVLIAVCGLSVWSWLTWGQKTDADGINVKAKADGVKVSWDKINYYSDLTALNDADIVADQRGLAKDLSYADGSPLTLDLITGNGIKFFEPKVNRRTGTVLTNPDSSWQGTVVDGNNSDGKYVDIDLYFRSEVKRDVFLAGDSAVNPKTTSGNYSDYGTFSKDYIAAASRVAFFDVIKTESADGTVTESIGDCSFVWAPNANVELIENESGYIKLTNTKTSEGGLIGGSLGDVIDFVTNTHGDYYLWLPTDYSSDPNTQDSSLAANKMKFTVFDEANNTGLYTFEYTIKEPNTGKEPSIIYYINQSGSSWDSNDISYVDISKSFANNDGGDVSPKVALSRNSFNLNSTTTQQDRKAPAFYVQGFKTQDIKITIGYNPVSKEVVVINYSSSGTDTKTYSRLGVMAEEVTYFELDNNSTCALVNPENSVAVSSLEGANFYKNVKFKDADKLFVTPLSITNNELYTVVKTGDAHAATYKFKNNSNNQYLTVTSGALSFTATGSEFTLKYVEGLDSPVVATDGSCLVVSNGVVKAVSESALNLKEAVTVYNGSTFELLTNSTSYETCYYYDYDKKEVVEQNSSSSPKLFSTPTTATATDKVGSIKIVSLTKENSDDTYYTAHIVMRVWVEGTDREAKTPLADGVFNLSLHFTSQ